MNLTLTVNESTVFQSSCIFKIDYNSIDGSQPLKQEFSMNFTCPNCTNGYNVGLKEYYVNQEVGMYDNRFTTSQNN